MHAADVMKIKYISNVALAYCIEGQPSKHTVIQKHKKGFCVSCGHKLLRKVGSTNL